MKKVIFAVWALLILSLSGCITTPFDQGMMDFDNNSNSLSDVDLKIMEMDLYKLQVDYNVLNDRLSDCVEAKNNCENDLDSLSDCPSASAPTDCNSIANSLGSQISICSNEKATIQNQLNTCNTNKDACNDDKDECLSDLALANAALAEVPGFSIYHYVSGNLFASGDYRYTQAFITDNTQKVIVGLDYTGGNDDHFSAGVTTTYGLNLVKWYVLTRTASGSFEAKIVKDVYESDAGDTVVLLESDGINVAQLKVKSTEYNAATSKEGLALRRLIVIYLE